MLLAAGSIAFWGVVAYLAFKPHTTQLPAMGPVEIARSRRGAPTPASPASARVRVERVPLPSGTSARLRLADRPARLALPQGATPMPGAVGAVPMPSRFE